MGRGGAVTAKALEQADTQASARRQVVRPVASVGSRVSASCVAARGKDRRSMASYLFMNRTGEFERFLYMHRIPIT